MSSIKLFVFLFAYFILNNACQKEWAQCGGITFLGEQTCCSPLTCVFQGDYYSQCRFIESPRINCQNRYSQCGGQEYFGNTNCCSNLTCVKSDSYWSSCQVVINTNETTNEINTDSIDNKTNENNNDSISNNNNDSSNNNNNDSSTNNSDSSNNNTVNNSSEINNNSIDNIDNNNIDPSVFTKNGKTTRYYDCCKPSCSWPGKALFTNPVNTCTKDSITLINNNEQSGCNGGTSYICSNQQPIVINDNLAYGFAAAKLGGQSESDWCCGCYELYFTGEDNQGGSSAQSIAGKRFVVQATNTGGDLGDNHFDLQLPGGGVGIFNGCTDEFKAPNGGWGDRYGGVHSIEECNALPEIIRSGCQFRFEFLGGADNPSVKLRRVRCPDEIIARTGCRRNDDSNYPRPYD